MRKFQNTFADGLRGAKGHFSTVIDKHSQGFHSRPTGSGNNSYNSACDDADDEQHSRMTQKAVSEMHETLFEVVKSQRAFSGKASAHSRSAVAWGSCLEKLGALERFTAQDDVPFLVSLAKFAQMEQLLAEAEDAFCNEAASVVATPVLKQIEVAIKDVKNARRQFEKAAADYAAIQVKVQKIQQQPTLDVQKLYQAEKEHHRLREAFGESREQMREALAAATGRLCSDGLDQVAEFQQVLFKLFADAYAELQDARDYIDDLDSWCDAEQDLFEERQLQRSAEITDRRSNVVRGVLAEMIEQLSCDFVLLGIICKVADYFPGINEQIATLFVYFSRSLASTPLQHHAVNATTHMNIIKGPGMLEAKYVPSMCRFFMQNFERIAKMLIELNEREMVWTLSLVVAKLDAGRHLTDSLAMPNATVRPLSATAHEKPTQALNPN